MGLTASSFSEKRISVARQSLAWRALPHFGTLRPGAADQLIALGRPLIVPAGIRRRGRFTLLGKRERLTRDAVLIVDPAAEINQLTLFRTKRTIRIILPRDRLLTVWTLHENNLFVAPAPVSGSGCCQRWRPLNQDSSPNEIDRTFTAHDVQAYSDAFAG